MLLKVENIQKKYLLGKTEVSVLKGIDFTVNRGEIIAVMGRSGAGKSTLLNVLGTLDRPDAGAVWFDQKNIFKYKDKQLSRFRNENIGFVFQFHYLLPEFTALENIILPGMITGKNTKILEKKAFELLEKMDMVSRAKHRTNELSGGEQQRIAFARALINNPKLILADEPSGNLDSESSGKLLDVMWSFAREFNTAFLVVTHDKAIAERADRVINIVDGVVR